MIFQDIQLDFDKTRVTNEMLSCSIFFTDIPPYDHWLTLAKTNKIFMVETLDRYDNITCDIRGKVTRKTIPPPQSFYLRSHDCSMMSYRHSKNKSEAQSSWNPFIVDNIPYTKKIIESLPFATIETVRVFIVKDSFLPTHHDGVYCDKSKNLGLSLVPIHSGTPLVYFDPESKKLESIFSSAFLFDDSYLHGIPMVHGLRIDIRVFGK